MYKVAILGCENSHANSFIKHIQENVEDIEILGVYSHEEEAMQKLHDEFGVYMMKSYDEFVDEADSIIVNARHGDNHYKYAKPYIKKGIPMFIDKPITVSEEDAVAFMKELKENNVKVCGGSMCVFDDNVRELAKNVSENTYGEVYGGYVRAPINMDNPHGGFFFYTQHLAQVMTTIFGKYPKSVKMFNNGKAYNGIVRYDEYDVNVCFVEGSYLYGAGISCQEKILGLDVTFPNGFIGEFEEYYNMLKGGAQPYTYKDLVAPVFILNAMYRSLQSGKEEPVNAYEI